MKPTAMTKPTGGPGDTQLVFLCLDYLRDLRRNNDESNLKGKKNLDADFISLAVFALSRSILRPDYLSNKKLTDDDIFETVSRSTNCHMIPHISKINQEILDPSENSIRPYDLQYDDLHPSNLYRFFKLKGLGSGSHAGPLSLDELVLAGLKQTDGRCRLDAEKDIVRNAQFEHYIQSVSAKGYFNDPENSGKRKDPKEEENRRARKAHVYKEKYRKAIAKYREKLATSVSTDGDTGMMLHSPPHSPPGAYSRGFGRNSSSFNSPPRSLASSRESETPLSPLTPNSVHEKKFSSPKSPQAAISIPKSPRSPQNHRSSSRQKGHTTPIRSSAPKSNPPSIPSETTTPIRPPPPKSSSAPTASGTAVSRHTSKAPSKSPLDCVSRDRWLRSRRKTSASHSGSQTSSTEVIKSSVQQHPNTLEAPHTPDPSGHTSVDSYEAPKTEIVTKPNQVKLEYQKPPVERPKQVIGYTGIGSPGLSLYEMKLVSSESSGLEVNAGSFYSVSPKHPRRRKSEYEKKLEESQRYKCPPSLAIPDMTDFTMKHIRSHPSISTSNHEGSVLHENNASNSSGLAAFKKAKQQFSPNSTSPVGRMRNEKKFQELERLRFGEPEDPARVTPVSSPRRVHNFSGAGSTLTSQHRSHFQQLAQGASQHRSHFQQLVEDASDDTKENEKKSSALKRSAFATAAKKNANAGRFGEPSSHTASDRPFTSRLPTNSPRAEINLDPYRLTPPKFFNNIGGASRLVAAKAGEVEGTNRPRGLASPRARHASPPAFHNSPPHRKHVSDHHEFDKSPTRRAC